MNVKAAKELIIGDKVHDTTNNRFGTVVQPAKPDYVLVDWGNKELAAPHVTCFDNSPFKDEDEEKEYAGVWRANVVKV